MYIKARAAGTEIEHNEELYDHIGTGTILQDKASVFIGSETTQDSYSRVPVDLFGKQVMAKLGWQEGQGIGKNQAGKPMVQPIEYIPR